MNKLILLISFCFGTVFSQTIELKINNLDSDIKVIKLHFLSGKKNVLIDSVSVTDKNRFVYSKKLEPSFYRLLLTNKKRIDFVYDGRSVQLQTDFNNINDSLKVIDSEVNKIYYEFRNLTDDYKGKSELLQLILARYPKEDKYYEVTKNRLDELQNEYLEFVYKTSQNNPDSFISRYIRSAHLPIVNYKLKPEKQLEELKSYALDNINFNDAGLINSDVFTNRTIEYLMYYRNPQLPKELLEKEFMKAIDSVLYKAKINQAVYLHIVEYLIDGFKRFGFDNVLNYIVENYVIKDDLCLDEKTGGMIKRRIDQAKILTIGTKVPEIVLPDEKGNEIKLTRIKTSRTLIIFYATWCPHCSELLPEIYKLYERHNNKQFEVVAVSMDNNKKEWQEFIQTNCPGWLNVSDQKGWNSKVTTDYYIYATPTMFLLDRDKKIIGKPLTMDELNQLLKYK